MMKNIRIKYIFFSSFSLCICKWCLTAGSFSLWLHLEFHLVLCSVVRISMSRKAGKEEKIIWKKMDRESVCFLSLTTVLHNPLLWKSYNSLHLMVHIFLLA